jgi:hypothetical protein
MSPENENENNIESKQNTPPSKKRYSIDRPVAEDLGQPVLPSHTISPPNTLSTTNTPNTRKSKKALIAGMVLLTVATGGIYLRKPLLDFVATRTALPAKEVTRLAIVNSTRLSIEQKKQYEKAYQDALSTPKAEARWSNLTTLVDRLIPVDYVAAVSLHNYIFEQIELRDIGLTEMRDRQSPPLSAEELRTESEKATVPRVKRALFEQALYAFAKSDGARALALYQEMPEGRQSSLIEERMTAEMGTDPQRLTEALTFARSMKDPQRSAALLSVFHVLLKKDITHAQSLLPEIRDAESQRYHLQAVETLAELLATDKPEQALAEIQRVQSAQNRLAMLQNIGMYIGLHTSYKLNRILSLAQTLPTDSEKDSFLTGVANGGGRTNGGVLIPLDQLSANIEIPKTRPVLAFQVASHLHDKETQYRLYLKIIREANQEDKNALVPYILAIKTEPLASELQKEIVMRLVNLNMPSTEQDAETAFVLAQKIALPSDKSKALRDIAIFWRNINPQKGIKIAQMIPIDDVRAKTLDYLNRYLT